MHAKTTNNQLRNSTPKVGKTAKRGQTSIKVRKAEPKTGTKEATANTPAKTSVANITATTKTNASTTRANTSTTKEKASTTRENTSTAKKKTKANILPAEDTTAKATTTTSKTIKAHARTTKTTTDTKIQTSKKTGTKTDIKATAKTGAKITAKTTTTKATTRATAKTTITKTGARTTTAKTTTTKTATRAIRATTRAITPERKPKNSKIASELHQKAKIGAHILDELYPNAKCALTFSTPFQLLVATVLSAQTTDQRVNMVTPKLFLYFPDAATMSTANVTEVSEIIRSIGLYQRKAANLVALAKILDEKYSGEVPDRRELLVELPGVGRKTANVVLGNCFGRQEITVDTHVGRLSRRLGWAESKNPEIVERELWQLLPDAPWTKLCLQLIEHGRKICHSRKPDCGNCPLLEVCPTGAI